MVSLFVLIGIAVPAVAAPRPKPTQPAVSAAEIPALASLLEKGCWTPTPEMSGIFRTGVIFNHSTNAVSGLPMHREALRDCFAAQSQVFTYTQAELISQLQTGVRVKGMGFGMSASGSIVKKMKFGTPQHTSIPELDLVPTDACKARLEAAATAGTDLSQMYVVQKVLTAEIAEQTCGQLDAQGNWITAGVSVEVSMACAQQSLLPVAVGYRTKPVTALPGLTHLGEKRAAKVDGTDARAAKRLAKQLPWLRTRS